MIITKSWRTMPGFEAETNPQIRRLLWKYGQALANRQILAERKGSVNRYMKWDRVASKAFARIKELKEGIRIEFPMAHGKGLRCSFK